MKKVNQWEYERLTKHNLQRSKSNKCNWFTAFFYYSTQSTNPFRYSPSG